jgi:hypothetical protein
MQADGWECSSTVTTAEQKRWAKAHGRHVPEGVELIGECRTHISMMVARKMMYSSVVAW